MDLVRQKKEILKTLLCQAFLPGDGEKIVADVRKKSPRGYLALRISETMTDILK